MQDQDTPSISDLIHDWIENDPDLAGHVQVIMQPFSDFSDGFYLDTACLGATRPRYTNGELAWFNSDATSSTWPHLDKETVPLNPADPNFFRTLRSLIKDAHNGSTQITAKGNKWHTPRFGCDMNI